MPLPNSRRSSTLYVMIYYDPSCNHHHNSLAACGLSERSWHRWRVFASVKILTGICTPSRLSRSLDDAVLGLI